MGGDAARAEQRPRQQLEQMAAACADMCAQLAYISPASPFISPIADGRRMR